MRQSIRCWVLAAGLAGLAAPALAQTLVVAALKTPGGVDGDALKPGTQNAVTQVYEGLTAYARTVDADGVGRLDFTKVVPHLAEGWTVTPDGRTYVFTLRKGVRSFFGNEMTAADVVWGWEKSIAQKRTGLFIANVTGVEKIEALDTHVVRFSLRAPSMVFLHLLTNYVPAIYDSTEVRKHATPEDPWALRWIDANTAGFGPYHMESVRQGEQAIFVANPNYFGGAPHYKRVVYREIPSGSSRYQLLLAGQAQWIEELTHKQVADLRRDRRVKVVGVEGTAMASVRMNTRFKPFDDVRVRRAMALATDYDGINAAVFEGLATRPRSIVPPIIPGHLASLPLVQPDAARAKALLAEAGYPNGFDTEIVSYVLPQWGAAVQGFLGAVGIRAKLSQLQVQAVVQRNQRGESPSNLGSWGSFSINDVSAILPVYFGGGADDYSRDPELIRLLEQAGSTMDAAARKTAYSAVIKRATEQAYWVPLHTYVTTYGLSRNLELKTYPDELPRFWLSKWK